MTAGIKPEVATKAPSAEAALELKRREISQEIASRPGNDLADMSDFEFTKGLERLKLVQTRMKRVLEEVLIEDVHFGREKTAQGKPVFKKDRLKKAGAEELRRLMKLTIRDTEKPEIQADAEWVSVVVTCGIFDAMGRLIAIAQGACNTKEKRFRKFDGSGWIYTDPREELHNCLAMARKRAGGLLTAEASGATGFFADGDEMTEALEEDDKPITPWTESEKAEVYAACSRKGVSRAALAEIVFAQLGRTAVGTGEEVTKVLAAIEKYVKPAAKLNTPPKPAPGSLEGLDQMPEALREELTDEEQAELDRKAAAEI